MDNRAGQEAQDFWFNDDSTGMTADDAAALVEFINTHDKRYVAAVFISESGPTVLLTRKLDGSVPPPILAVRDYGGQHVSGEGGFLTDQDPSLVPAWTEWLAAWENA